MSCSKISEGSARVWCRWSLHLAFISCLSVALTHAGDTAKSSESLNRGEEAPHCNLYFDPMQRVYNEVRSCIYEPDFVVCRGCHNVLAFASVVGKLEMRITVCCKNGPSARRDLCRKGATPICEKKCCDRLYLGVTAVKSRGIPR
eukprot:911190-Rhodomonas_salina.3